MSVSDYLKSASAELSKAVDLLRREIDDLRNEERHLRTTLERQVGGMLDQMRLHDQEMKRTDMGRDTSRLKDAIRDLDVQVAQTKKLQQDEQNRIADAIRDREGMISQLQSQASSIMP